VYKIASWLNLMIAIIWLALPIWSLAHVFSLGTILYCVWPLCLLVGSVLLLRGQVRFVATGLCVAGTTVLSVLVIRDIIQADIDFFGLRLPFLCLVVVSVFASLYLIVDKFRRPKQGSAA